jgi:hypothetical protein
MIDDKPDGSHVTQTSKEVEENSAGSKFLLPVYCC